MSQENIATVTRFYAEVGKRKALPPEFFAPDCVTDWAEVSPDFNRLEGVDATQKALGPYFETFDNYHVDVLQVVRMDQHRVVVAVRDGGRIRGSGAEVWNRYFHAWVFREGKATWLSSHTNQAQALKAVGLEE